MKYILLFLILFVIYVLFENRCVLAVRHEKTGSGIRIAHISDLHKRRFGRDNSWLCGKVRRERPDIIFITGDLVSRRETDLTVAEKTVKELTSIAPVYMIFGNHEQDLSDAVKAEYVRIAGKYSAHLLRNEKITADIKGRRLYIYGLMESYDVYKINGRYRNLKVLEKNDITKLVGDCPDGEVLLLAHNPFFGEAYSQWGADYIFSGHVHGGIVRLFGKAMLSPERKPFPKVSKGIYSYNGKKLLVSAGLGKMRLFDPPEIVIYDI